MWFDVMYATKNDKGNVIKLGGNRHSTLEFPKQGATSLWEMPPEIVKLAEANGHAFWDCRSGIPTKVSVIETTKGWYLRSVANESITDNLDNLPKCPEMPKK